ncbi:unnamed protein product [Cyclocybe aegerita]|uniref:Uncharacterized protein n=1 Tax=Cyclocybe aegerita TaxID=1973307 RepID=A0A8S0X7X5_CYCAE|nr:unnamed protein product [Cyclocybe aegerita]
MDASPPCSIDAHRAAVPPPSPILDGFDRLPPCIFWLRQPSTTLLFPLGHNDSALHLTAATMPESRSVDSCGPDPALDIAALVRVPWLNAPPSCQPDHTIDEPDPPLTLEFAQDDSSEHFVITIRARLDTS